MRSKLVLTIFRSRKGLHLANLLAVDNQIIKPATMSDTAVFVALGDDGGYSQALLRAYQGIGGAKGIVMREVGVEPLDLTKIALRCSQIESIEDSLFDIHDLEDDQLLKMTNKLEDLNLEAIESIKENCEAEAVNGAALFIASKTIEFTNLWNQEIEFKPYFIYYAIAGLTCLERNGNMIIKIYDIHTQFTKTLIYLLSCNFTTTEIIQPFSMNAFTSERFLVCHRMLHKDLKEGGVIDQLKKIYTSLKTMHIQKSNDLDTLLVESTLKKAGFSLQGNPSSKYTSLTSNYDLLPP